MQFLLPDKVYDTLKYIVTVALPALSVAYVGFAAIWGWPLADEIARSEVVLFNLLCALMGISGAVAVIKQARGTGADPDDTAELGKHSGGSNA